jgi:hypothetical protein
MRQTQNHILKRRDAGRQEEAGSILGADEVATWIFSRLLRGGCFFSAKKCPSDNCRVPHISLVFREMWGATVGRPLPGSRASRREPRDARSNAENSEHLTSPNEFRAADIAEQISAYLTANNYTRISFGRVKELMGLTEQQIRAVIQQQPTKFRYSLINGNKAGKNYQVMLFWALIIQRRFEGIAEITLSSLNCWTPDGWNGCGRPGVSWTGFRVLTALKLSRNENSRNVDKWQPHLTTKFATTPDAKLGRYSVHPDPFPIQHWDNIHWVLRIEISEPAGRNSSSHHFIFREKPIFLPIPHALI